MMYDIVCICESWLEKEITLSNLLSEFSCYESLATRTHSTGHASGGLLLLIKNKFSSNCIFKTNDCIFVDIGENDSNFILGLNYINTPNSDNSLANLRSALDLIQANFNLPTYIVGDFNVHVGELNQLPSQMVTPATIYNRRSSLDISIDHPGLELTNLLETEFFILLNGRTPSDSPAQMTFANAIGSSVIDLVWCNYIAFDYIKDLKVLNTTQFSDHFQIHFSIYSRSNITQESLVNYSPPHPPSPKWIPEFAQTFISHLTHIPPSISENVNSNNDTLINQITNAARESDMFTKPRSIRSNQNLLKRKLNPWYDRDCTLAKQQTRRALNKCRKSDFSDADRKFWLECSAIYKTLLHHKKKTYQLATLDTLATTRNSTTFWKIINNLKPKQRSINLIQLNTWHQFLQNLYAYEPPTFIHPQHIYNPSLDSDITIAELNNILKKCPGDDKISYEFYKNLPNNWLYFIVHSFNKIIHQQRIPDNWGNMLAFMLPKKGDLTSPDNYRCISLINSITKMFTNIMNERLYLWAEANSVLPEFQAGFRRSRSCADHIFALNTCIQSFYAKPRQKLYVCFVDFRKAFDMVDHEVLWAKLLSLGVSSCFINILIDLYNKATTRIVTPEGKTPQVSISRGVMQGDSLSPLLFSLLISDLEKFFKDNDVSGISISHLYEFIILAFADDLVILADSVPNLKRKLKLLHEYCERNKLMVNDQKTKVMIFGKTSYINPNLSFSYGGAPLEIVKSYKYLGVTIANNGSFRLAAEQFATSARVAMASVFATLMRCKADTFDIVEKLFLSSMQSTLLYSKDLERPTVRPRKSSLKFF